MGTLNKTALYFQAYLSTLLIPCCIARLETENNCCRNRGDLCQSHSFHFNALAWPSSLIFCSFVVIGPRQNSYCNSWLICAFYHISIQGEYYWSSVEFFVSLWAENRIDVGATLNLGEKWGLKLSCCWEGSASAMENKNWKSRCVILISDSYPLATHHALSSSCQSRGSYEPHCLLEKVLVFAFILLSMLSIYPSVFLTELNWLSSWKTSRKSFLPMLSSHYSSIFIHKAFGMLSVPFVSPVAIGEMLFIVLELYSHLPVSFFLSVLQC